MPRKLFAFLLAELHVVRIICRQAGCGAVVEVAVAQVAARMTTPRCAVCGADLLGPYGGPGNDLVKLAAAIEALKAHGKTVGVEFVLPDVSAG